MKSETKPLVCLLKKSCNVQLMDTYRSLSNSIEILNKHMENPIMYSLIESQLKDINNN